MIYLDNSSTTHQKPYSVIKATLKGVTKLSTNPSRGGYPLTTKGGIEIYKCREKLANLINTNPNNIIFTSGCTMALNMAIKGTSRKNGHIIATIYEHNSTLRVLNYLEENYNITYTLVEPDKNGLIDIKKVKNEIKPNTYMLITNHTSNVTGITQNIEKLGHLAKKHNLIYLVDGAQSVGHEDIDMIKMNINLLTIAGHKGLYAPQGIGVLAINNCKVRPLLQGGTGTHSDKIKQPSDYPDGLESGTPNIVGILGLSAGVDFVTKHQKQINRKLHYLTKYLIDNLRTIYGIKIYSNNTNSGVVSFNLRNLTSVDVSNYLGERYNICTRSGLHCAPLVHKYYGTIKSGMVRISLSYFNKKKDIDKLILALKELNNQQI